MKASILRLLRRWRARPRRPFEVSCRLRRKRGQRSSETSMLRHVTAASGVPGMDDDDIESRTLPRVLLRQAERLGDKRFLNINGSSASFQEALEISTRFANGLQRLGVRPSDRIAILLPNCFEFVIAWF